MLSAFHSRFRKSQAAVVIENILSDVVEIPLEQITFSAMANNLIRRVWESNPDLFDGKLGQRPHKLTVAACAMASGLECFERNSTNYRVLLLSLGVAINEIRANGQSYKFSPTDTVLLNFSYSIFDRETEKAAESPLGRSLASSP